MKRTIMISVALMTVLSVLAGCGNKTVEHAVSIPESTEQLQQQEPVKQEKEMPDWVTLDADIGTMTVRLPIVKDSYYRWTMDISEETVAELLNSSEASGEFIAGFRGLSDGVCTIRFDYICADALAETRTISFEVGNGKIREVLSAEVELVEGIRDNVAQPEWMEMLNDNQLDKVLASHNALTCVSETWIIDQDGEEQWRYGSVEQYIEMDGELRYFTETKDAEGNIITVSDSYIKEGTPGMYCIADPMSGFKYVELYPADEYRAAISRNWLYRDLSEPETVVSIEEDEQYHLSVMTTEMVYDEWNIRNEFVYYVDAETGLLSGMEQWTHDATPGRATTVTRSNIVYDEPREIEQSLAMKIMGADVLCQLTFTVNTGKGDEEIWKIGIEKGVMTDFTAERSFELFSDAEYTQSLYEIDTDCDKADIWVKYTD